MCQFWSSRSLQIESREGWGPGADQANKQGPNTQPEERERGGAQERRGLTRQQQSKWPQSGTAGKCCGEMGLGVGKPHLAHKGSKAGCTLWQNTGEEFREKAQERLLSPGEERRRVPSMAGHTGTPRGSVGKGVTEHCQAGQ